MIAPLRDHSKFLLLPLLGEVPHILTAALKWFPPTMNY